MKQERSPVWTIRRDEIAAFFGYFTTLMICGFTFVGLYENRTNEALGTFGIIREMIGEAGSITAGSAGIAIAVSEIARWIMVIASYFRDKFLKPQRDRYREEGREEITRQWTEWNRRRLEAQERGDDFNEPPPGGEQGLLQ